MSRFIVMQSAALTLIVIAISSTGIAQDTPRVARSIAGPTSTASSPDFTFYLFWKEDNQATRVMNAKLNETLASKGRQTQVIAVNANDAANREIVERYKASRAPMPLVICVAANGAITGAIPEKLNEQAVERLLITPSMTQCMKALQENKLVLVHVKADDMAVMPKGASEFAADPAFQGRTSIISFRRDNPNEARFLTDMQVDSKTNGSFVSLLAPPGVLVGKYSDNVTKAQIATELHAAGQCCNDPNCKHNKQGK